MAKQLNELQKNASQADEMKHKNKHEFNDLERKRKQKKKGIDAKKLVKAGIGNMLNQKQQEMDLQEQK